MYKIAATIAVFFSFTVFSFAYSSPGKASGYVNDFAGMLSSESKQSLEHELTSFTASTSNEIAVVIIPSLDGDTVENYAVKLFEEWKIGKAKQDNGVLLLIARDDHKMRIEVGYGLEGALPDILSKDIIDSKIAPAFKQGNYDAGVVGGVRAIEEATKGEYVQTASEPFSFSGKMIEAILLFLFFVVQFLASILARSKSWWAGGVIGGFLGGIATYFGIFGAGLFIGSAITIVLVILGLLFDYIVSSGYNNAIRSGSSIPWWSGGSSGYSSSSFGGFGGGSSGGGGASGSW